MTGVRGFVRFAKRIRPALFLNRRCIEMQKCIGLHAGHRGRCHVWRSGKWVKNIQVCQVKTESNEKKEGRNNE